MEEGRIYKEAPVGKNKGYEEIYKQLLVPQKHRAALNICPKTVHFLDI